MQWWVEDPKLANVNKNFPKLYCGTRADLASDPNDDKLRCAVRTVWRRPGPPAGSEAEGSG